ncbi:MAG: hypothetical protein IJ861_00740, partial [Clostridia bacterium]|nr:hypothetical protein [Clostridia bacterium]
MTELKGEINPAKIDDAAFIRLAARVNNLVTHNTDTENNSELIDVRIGNDGIVYESAGAAVRGQIAGINNSAVFCADHRVTSSVDEYYDANNVPPGKIIAYGNSGTNIPDLMG